MTEAWKKLKVAVLTDSASWMLPYSRTFCEELTQEGIEAELFEHHEDVDASFGIVFILSYFRLVPRSFLDAHAYNLVVHESALPKGRGWAPMFWQILEGKNRIPIVLFQAVEGADEGDIYLEDEIVLDGTELHDELRKKQAEKTFEMCRVFLSRYPDVESRPQSGAASRYPKRTPVDSALDIGKSIKEQFNLLRISDHKLYPAFFEYKGVRYFVKLEKDQ